MTRKLKKLLLPFPYQPNGSRIDRAAHQNSELLLHSRESREKGTHLVPHQASENPATALLCCNCELELSSVTFREAEALYFTQISKLCGA